MPVATTLFLKGGLRGWIVAQDFAWEIGKRGSGWVLIVPAGREFESSVPRLLWWLWSPDDPVYLKAAAVHDVLLESGYRGPFADSQWVEVALSEHAPRLKTIVGYLVMRLRRIVIVIGQPAGRLD